MRVVASYRRTSHNKDFCHDLRTCGMGTSVPRNSSDNLKDTPALHRKPESCRKVLFSHWLSRSWLDRKLICRQKLWALIWCIIHSVWLFSFQCHPKRTGPLPSLAWGAFWSLIVPLVGERKRASFHKWDVFSQRGIHCCLSHTQKNSLQWQEK